MARRERRRLCKFISDWTASDEFSSWLAPVKGEKHKAYCLLCKKAFAVSHGGLNDVKAHYKGKRHIRLQQEKIAAGFSNQWNSAEDSWVKGIFYKKVDGAEAGAASGSLLSCEEGTSGGDSSQPVWEAGPGRPTSDWSEDSEDKEEAAAAAAPAIADTQHHYHHQRSPDMNMQQKMLPQQYCLRWKYHHNNLQVMFSQLLERESFCDVTLACEGKTLRAHKVVLSACSTYFDSIFSQYEEKNPIVILKDVKFTDIKALVEFMYRGEINIDHSHLASLLKAAEDLRIKGLAEVSWRSDGGQGTGSGEEGVNCAEGPPARSDLGSDLDQEPPVKRKRGRPPLDGGSSTFSPKVMSVSGNVGTEEAFTEGAAAADTDLDNDVKTWEEQDTELVARDNTDPHAAQGLYPDQEQEQAHMKPLQALQQQQQQQQQQQPPPQPQQPMLQPMPQPMQQPAMLTPSHIEANAPATSCVSQRIAEQYRDVVKLNDYLTTGRRQQFWEEPFTRRIMEAIKSKELEMKAGAELLGVSYGTLYGRYRDAYGCLKHPYRISMGTPMEALASRLKGAGASVQPMVRDRNIVRDFWSESGPADVLAKVQRKEITLFRAAEMLNVTVTTLAHYLSTLQPGGGTSSGDEAPDEPRESDDFYENPMPIAAAAAVVHKKLATTALENNPDITIVKQEPLMSNHEQAEEEEEDDEASSSSVATNNNAEHLDSDAGDGEQANGMEDMMEAK